MNPFFERTETDSEIVVTYKPHFIYILLCGLATLFVSEVLPHLHFFNTISGAVWVCVIVVMIWRYVSMRQIMSEIRMAMKNGAVTISGSKLSFTNPMTVRIPKRAL